MHKVTLRAGKNLITMDIRMEAHAAPLGEDKGRDALQICFTELWFRFEYAPRGSEAETSRSWYYWSRSWHS